MKTRGFEVCKGYEDKDIHLPVRKTKHSAFSAGEPQRPQCHKGAGCKYSRLKHIYAQAQALEN